MDIALITDANWPELSRDDALLLPTLAERGLRARPLVWSDPAVDWSEPLICVLRSVWGYQHRRAAFLAWAERVARPGRFWNPLPVIRWNTHKSYLRDLERAGIPTIPTAWLERGSAASLAALLAERGWERAVLKPAVGASAEGALLVSRENLAQAQTHLDTLLATQDMLLQSFQQAVTTSGERSLIFVAGEFTHAIRRRPELGLELEDQQEGAALVAAEDDELALARAALRQVDAPLLYARVDMVRDAAGEPRLMELELTEPWLGFALAPQALQRFADALVRMAREARTSLG